MFHSSTPQHNKVILRSLTRNNGVVRVVFATVALGMGVNINDILNECECSIVAEAYVQVIEACVHL